MKKISLKISKHFPVTHKRSGEPTSFMKFILDCEKKHTIRANYNFWKQAEEKVAAGTHEVNVEQWIGRPYHTSPRTHFKMRELTVQKLQFTNEGIYINDKITALTIQDIAHNDGLSVEDFLEWFNPLPSDPCAIILFHPSFAYNI